MENRDILIGVLGFFLVIAILFGWSYGTYKYGRFVERRALTQALADSIQNTCNECYNEGGKVGYKQGKAAGLKHCDYLIDEDSDGGHR